MSEQPVAAANGSVKQELNPSAELFGDGDKTQLSEEIVASLKQLEAEKHQKSTSNGQAQSASLQLQNQGQENKELEAQVSQKTDIDETPKTPFELLRESLKTNPHQPEAWQRLVDMAEASGETAKIKEAYEGVLENYPNTVRVLSASRLHPPPSFQNECSSDFTVCHLFMFRMCATLPGLS